MSDDQPAFDVYAKPYVPLKWREINEIPMPIRTSMPAPGIDFNDYVLSFAGRWLAPDIGNRATGLASIQAESPPDSGLDLATYSAFFSHALASERQALQQECEEYNLYNVYMPVAGHQWPSTLLLTVPGLREMSLRVEIGDVVHLRQLRFQFGEPAMAPVTNNRGQPIFSAYSLDVQHDAVVWGIDRVHEILSLRVDNFVPGTFMFNVRFAPQHARLESLKDAVTDTGDLLLHEQNAWLRSMLFPHAGDGIMQKKLNPMFSSLKLFDWSLNYEQTKAVEAVLDHKYGHVPYLVSGPPGTGKTKSVVEMALQLLKHTKTAHLLLCTPSDPAADILVQRLRQQLMPKDLFRLNAPSRSLGEMPDTVLPYCCIENGIFTLPPFPDLMRKKVVVVSCRDAAILHRARLTNRYLFRLEQAVHAGIHPEVPPSVPQVHWTGLIIDEAAQATEPEALLPLLVVTPPEESTRASMLPSVVMVGDQNQLGPRTAWKDPSIQTSLFERLLTRTLYDQHPLARSQRVGGAVRPLTQEMLPIIRPPFTDLVRNYRSHPAILASPSSLFYRDTLEPCAAETQSLQPWSGFSNHDMPVLFAECGAPDEIERDGGGWYNVGEADLALTMARSFLNEGLLSQREICLISPFRAQVRTLRTKARELNLWDLNIGPLEAFQGLESRLVIICTTRTRDRFVDQDIAKGLGVIHEPRRLNVALTRAKEGLVVIGNPNVLDQDENWASFLAFCQRNGAWQGKDSTTWQPPHSHKIRTSRLEKQMAYKNGVEAQANGVARRLGNLKFGMSEEEAIWQSGVEAEEMLDEDDGEGGQLQIEEGAGISGPCATNTPNKA